MGGKKKVCVAGGAGFIGSHLAKRLKDQEGCYVVVADWKVNEFMEQGDYCDEFHLVDLRRFDMCVKATAGCEEVYNLAADMGGMGFIQSNHANILFNNTTMSFNMIEAARVNGAKRYMYSSSACIYPEFKQETETIVGLKEDDAWPAQPQDAYGLEKLVSEEIALHYERDFGMKCRVARFHNIYGPYGTWRGGREKAPAAFLRKAATSTESFEMWGNGLQTRSFCYIDDGVEGILRIMQSDYTQPLNLGTDEGVTMLEMAQYAMDAAGKTLPLKHIPGPEGVRGRNSDNTLIRKVLGWAPSIPVAEGLKRTLPWIQEQINKFSPEEQTKFATSEIVKQDEAMAYTGDLPPEEAFGFIPASTGNT